MPAQTTDRTGLEEVYPSMVTEQAQNKRLILVMILHKDIHTFTE